MGDAFAGVEKMIPETFFSFSFLRKDKNPLTRLRKSKYDDDQGGQTWPHESSDISEGEISKLPAGKHGTD